MPAVLTGPQARIPGAEAPLMIGFAGAPLMTGTNAAEARLMTGTSAAGAPLMTAAGATAGRPAAKSQSGQVGSFVLQLVIGALKSLGFCYLLTSIPYKFLNSSRSVPIRSARRIAVECTHAASH